MPNLVKKSQLWYIPERRESFTSRSPEVIINDRLTKYLDEHNIIHNNQIGFRKGYRTSHHVFVLKTLIDLYTKNADKKV